MVIGYLKPEMVGGFDLKRRDVEEIQELFKVKKTNPLEK